MHINNTAKSLIFNEHGQLLLLVRSATDERRAGEYDLPGGAVEPGEDFVTAASREIQEETGLVIDPHELRLVYTGTRMDPKYPDESVNRFVFLAEVREPQVQLSFEHDAFEWMEIDKVLSVFQHAFYVPAIEYLQGNGLLPVH